MKRTALWLGAATVIAGVAMPRAASAAEMFADVPQDHWAYQAVNNLQERGIVIGYPDGTFGGKRAMTRYEFAVATDRLVDWVNRTVQTNFDELKKLIGTGGPTPTGGLSREEVEGMINDKLRGLPTKEDLETVRRLSEEFRDELTALGTNVDALRRDLDGLKARVGAIEEKLAHWSFSGEANLIARGERGDKSRMGLGAANIRRPVIDLDSRTDNNGTTNMLNDLKTLYNLDFGITGKVSSGVTANVLLNYGNYLPWVDTNRQNPGVFAGAAVAGYASDISNVPAVPSALGPGAPLSNALSSRTITQGNTGKDATNQSFSEFTPVKLYLNSPVRDLFFLKDIDLTVGKFGTQFTPYTLRNVDPDSYTNVTRTDNGEVIMTGAMGRANIGSVHLQGYAANHYTGRATGAGATTSGDPLFISYGGPTILSGMTYGALPIDQSTGVHGNVNFGRFAIGGTFLEGGVSVPLGTPGSVFSSNPWANRANPNNGGRRMLPKRAQIYGGDLRFPIFGNLAFAGEFSSSNILAGVNHGDREGVFPSNKRNAFDTKLTWNAGNLSLAGGYKQVDPFFGAPGSWGNIGRWKNPNNIKGFSGSAGYNFGGFQLKGSFEDYKSVLVNLAAARPGSGITIPTGFGGVALSNAFENKIQHYTAGVSFNLTPTNAIDLGWEQARIRPFDTAQKTKENYWTLGLGHTFNQNTLVKVMYQMVDYKDNGAGLYTVPNGAYKGGVGVTELSVRF